MQSKIKISLNILNNTFSLNVLPEEEHIFRFIETTINQYCQAYSHNFPSLTGKDNLIIIFSFIQFCYELLVNKHINENISNTDKIDIIEKEIENFLSERSLI